MAKRRSNQEMTAEDLPGVAVAESRKPVVESTLPKPKKSPPPAAKVEIEVRSLSCKIPAIVGINGYSRSQVLTRFNGDEATTLKAILMGLEQEGAKLNDGRFVRTQSHALRWIIQNATK
jgi:hypothetical protein